MPLGGSTGHVPGIVDNMLVELAYVGGPHHIFLRPLSALTMYEATMKSISRTILLILAMVEIKVVGSISLPYKVIA